MISSQDCLNSWLNINLSVIFPRALLFFLKCPGWNWAISQRTTCTNTITFSSREQNPEGSNQTILMCQLKTISTR